MSSCTSSCTAPTRFGGGSHTIGARELTAADRTALLHLARHALEAFVIGGSPPALPDARAVRERRGAFVTLEAAGALRGCIGHVPADRPLGEVVRDVAVAAARDDPRFDPVNRTELADLRIEISVLTEPVALRPVAVDRIVMGRDGVMVRRGGAMSVLLPQVGREQGWDAAALLRAACHKAGLRPDAWREPGTEVLTFQADVFGETGEG